MSTSIPLAVATGGLALGITAEIALVVVGVAQGAVDGFIPHSPEGWTLWTAFLFVIFGIGTALVKQTAKGVNQQIAQTASIDALVKSLDGVISTVVANHERGELSRKELLANILKALDAMSAGNRTLQQDLRVDLKEFAAGVQIEISRLQQELARIKASA